MMTPKQNPVRPAPVIAPNSAPVKPNSAPQFARMLPRTPKPTPVARIATKPAQSNRAAFGVIPSCLIFMLSRSNGLSVLRRNRSDPDAPELDHQRLALRNAQSGVNRHAEFALAYAVDLEADEALRMGLVDLLVDKVFDQMTIHPGLNPRPSRDDTQFVPTLGNEVAMTLIDLLLR